MDVCIFNVIPSRTCPPTSTSCASGLFLPFLPIIFHPKLLLSLSSLPPHSLFIQVSFSELLTFWTYFFLSVTVFGVSHSVSWKNRPFLFVYDKSYLPPPPPPPPPPSHPRKKKKNINFTGRCPIQTNIHAGKGIKNNSLLYSNWKRQSGAVPEISALCCTQFVLVMRLQPLLTIHSGHSPAGLIIALEWLWLRDM